MVASDGKLSEPLGGIPKVHGKGQGGLLDVALSPGFAQNRLVFLSFAEDRGDGRAGTSVARGRLNEAGTALENTQVIFRQEPPHTGNNHWGSRLVFDKSGNLFVTLGDRFDLRSEAQNPGQPPRKGRAHHPGRKTRPGQPVSGPEGDAAGNLVDWPPQRAGRRSQSGHRPVMDRRARGARRRRDQHSAEGQELRLADHHLRGGLFRREDRRGHQQAGHGTAGLSTGIRPSPRPAWRSTPATSFPPGAATFSSVRSRASSSRGWRSAATR